MAQICEIRMGNTDEPESSWPQVRLSVFPAEPREGEVNVFSGVMGSNMSWGVWTIGQSGRVAVSPVAHFKVQPPASSRSAVPPIRNGPREIPRRGV